MENIEIKKNFQIGCKAKEISSVIEKIFSELDSIEFNLEIKLNVELAAREMLANAIEHGCTSESNDFGNSKKSKVLIILKINNNKLFLTVQDPGSGFDWENHDLHTMPLYDEKGRGLKMIKQVSDQLEFNKSGNRITAIFEL